MKKLFKNILTFFLIGLIMASFTGCGAIVDSIKNSGGTDTQEEKIVKSEDGKFQVSLPSDWEETTELNDIAVIQAANMSAEKYLVVISESTADFTEDVSLEDFAELSMDNILYAAENSTSTDFEDITVNGLSGKAFEVQGEVSNVKACYYVIALKGKDHLHQIITWTLNSKYDENIEELKQAAQSFMENE